MQSSERAQTYHGYFANVFDNLRCAMRGAVRAAHPWEMGNRHVRSGNPVGATIVKNDVDVSCAGISATNNMGKIKLYHNKQNCTDLHAPIIVWAM